MQEQVLSINDYIEIFTRRRKFFAITASGLTVAALLLAFLLPSVYRSTATILIESQDIPVELISSTVTSYATERLQIINQRTMTTANLLRIIKKYNLYPEKRKKTPTEEIIKKMTGDIKLKTINAEVVDPRSGRPSTATIAFKLSYDSENPASAQKVANELTNLYLKENISERNRKASETSSFLSEEGDKLSENITELEKQLADFKRKNINNLPELTSLNLQMMETSERDSNEINRQLRSLKEQQIMLQAQLTQINPYTNVTSSTGERILGSDDRLKYLQADYERISAIYSKDHPDLVKMRREIASLQKEVKTEETTTVVSLSGSKFVTSADNPAYIQIRAQLDAVEKDLSALKLQHLTVKRKLRDYEVRIISAPQVERQYKALSRDYENAVREYQEISDKQLEAVLSEELEKGSKGERFTLIDSPLYPEKPVKPNRKVIILLGVIFALAGGLGAIILSESIDPALRGMKSTMPILGISPLAAIPYIELPDESIKKEINRKLFCIRNIIYAGIVACVFLLTTIIVHFTYKPLDVIWFVLLRKLNL